MEDVEGAPRCMGICEEATSGARTESRQSSRIGRSQQDPQIIRSTVGEGERWSGSVLSQSRVAAAPSLCFWMTPTVAESDSHPSDNHVNVTCHSGSVFLPHGNFLGSSPLRGGTVSY